MQEPGYTAHAKRAVLFSVLVPLAWNDRQSGTPAARGCVAQISVCRHLSLGDSDTCISIEHGKPFAVLRGKRLASESGATSTSSTAAAVLDHADHADRRS